MLCITLHQQNADTKYFDQEVRGGFIAILQDWSWIRGFQSGGSYYYPNSAYDCDPERIKFKLALVFYFMLHSMNLKTGLLLPLMKNSEVYSPIQYSAEFRIY